VIPKRYDTGVLYFLEVWAALSVLNPRLWTIWLKLGVNPAQCHKPDQRRYNAAATYLVSVIYARFHLAVFHNLAEVEPKPEIDRELEFINKLDLKFMNYLTVSMN